jgi:hypothetical protein
MKPLAFAADAGPPMGVELRRSRRAGCDDEISAPHAVDETTARGWFLLLERCGS